MAREPMRRGPIAERLSANLRTIRRERGLEQAELSDRLDALGHPIGANSISRLEKGDRRADVADLVALALALGVTPNRLMLTADADSNVVVGLTPHASATSYDAWRWAAGDRALPSADGADRLSEIREFPTRNRPHDPPSTVQSADLQAYEPGLERITQYIDEANVPRPIVIEWLRLLALAARMGRGDKGEDQ